MDQRLTDREQDILRLVVESFISTAGPVGSRALSRQKAIELSPASIRNTMSDLEEKGYLDHPYTSSGRVPTERGYRAFVDELMETPELQPAERELLSAQLARLWLNHGGHTEELLRECSRLLGQLSNLLGVVLSPRLSTGVLDRLEVVPLSATRVMFVVSMRGGLVKTIVLECTLDDHSRSDLNRIVALLNERLAGLPLQEIRRTYAHRIRDLKDETTGVVRLVLDKSTVLFSEPADGRLALGGAHHLMTQPEFQQPDDLRSLIELLEDEHFVVHVLEEGGESDPAGTRITIGEEHSRKKLRTCSIVTARYHVGRMVGTIGLLGPTRMNYPHAVALVEGMAILMNSREIAAE